MTGRLCADLDGFSLHAAVRLPAGARRRLEQLCRYAARPAIAESRLSMLPDGRVTGLFELDLPVPNVPAIVGVEVHLQTLHAAASGLAFGNLASTRIER